MTDADHKLAEPTRAEQICQRLMDQSGWIERIGCMGRTGELLWDAIDLIRALASRPTPAEDLQRYIPDIVKNAMLVTWRDICSDTKCHPLDIEHGKNKHLYFEPRHWAQMTGDNVAETLKRGGYSYMTREEIDASTSQVGPAPTIKCDRCNGRGTVGDKDTDACPKCHGCGRVSVSPAPAAEVKLATRPVAFRVVDPKLGNVALYQHDQEENARNAAENYGVEYHGLYVRDGTPLIAPAAEGAGESIMAARQIVCEEWHNAVKEFGLHPGSRIETVVGRIIERLDDRVASPDAVRPKVVEGALERARKIVGKAEDAYSAAALDIGWEVLIDTLINDIALALSASPSPPEATPPKPDDIAQAPEGRVTEKEIARELCCGAICNASGLPGDGCVAMEVHNDQRASILRLIARTEGGG